VTERESRCKGYLGAVGFADDYEYPFADSSAPLSKLLLP
jgi:hypothetical protein